jgi:hypothetical protein
MKQGILGRSVSQLVGWFWLVIDLLFSLVHFKGHFILGPTQTLTCFGKNNMQLFYYMNTDCM